MRQPFLIGDERLAVDHGVDRIELANRLHNCREAIGPVVKVASKNLDFAFIETPMR